MVQKIACPNCGTEMNCHAEKFMYSESASGGHVEEIHSCPNCGRSESSEERAIADGEA
jgi:ribosomal protein S27AE